MKNGNHSPLDSFNELEFLYRNGKSMTCLLDTILPPSGIRQKASDQWRREISKRV